MPSHQTMTDETSSLTRCRWLSRTRGIKAILATGFLMVFGMMMLLAVTYQADRKSPDSLTATFKDATLLAPKIHQDDDKAPSTTPKPQHRVFDVILLNDELDMLEIRLNELESVVDVFFIMEAEYTFSGKPKPLYFREHETRFRQFRDKIIHITIPPLSKEDKAQYAEVGGWANEMFARNMGFKIATDVRKPNEGDWIILSDLDEIPKRSFLKIVKAPDADTEIGRRLLEGLPESDGDVFKLGCQFYYYSFEYRHRGDWYGPTLMRYRNPDSPIFTRSKSDPYPGLKSIHHIMENNWSDAGSRLRERNVENTPYFDGQCHHCTWCFSNITQVTRKMHSYSHTEHSESTFTNKAWILDHYRQGIDLFERKGELYDYIKDNQDLPQYVRDNSDRFSFMLRRKGLANAGFIDVDPVNPLKE